MHAALQRLTRDGAASITNHDKTRFRSYCRQQLLALPVLLRSAAFSVSGTIAVSSFKRLWSYRGQRQIVAMEEKELRFKSSIQIYTITNKLLS